jgi:hypothetical protein
VERSLEREVEELTLSECMTVLSVHPSRMHSTCVVFGFVLYSPAWAPSNSSATDTDMREGV